MKEFFDTTARNKTVTLNTGAGFYPFGPDKGDHGVDHTASVVSSRFSGALADPYNYHEVTLELEYHASSAYTPDLVSSEGTFDIGTATDLMMPQDRFNFDREIVNTPQVTRGGVVNYSDTEADIVASVFTVQASPPNTAALITYLTETARGGVFSVSGYNPFLPYDNGSMRLRRPEITVTHTGPNRMSVDIEVVRE